MTFLSQVQPASLPVDQYVSNGADAAWHPRFVTTKSEKTTVLCGALGGVHGCESVALRPPLGTVAVCVVEELEPESPHAACPNL